jgi:hypothetical protein
MYGRFTSSGMSSSGTVKWPITINTLFNLQLTLVVSASGSTDKVTLAYKNSSSSTTKFDWNLIGSGTDFRGFFWEAIASVS